jgi:hypothetical protein
MDDLLQQLLKSVNEVNQNVNRIDQSIHHMEQRLARLEKMDSIEHRVTVNQIDLTDIKEVLGQMNNFQKEGIDSIVKLINKNIKNIILDEEIKKIHNRLDAHLTKIAQNEEAILIQAKN